MHASRFLFSWTRTGFTLIEVIIAVSIVSLMSAILLVSLPTLRLQTRVNITAQNVQDLIREARRRSTSIVEFVPGSGLYPSYGAYFDTAAPSQAILYADCVLNDNGDAVIDNNDNFMYNPSSASCAGTNGNVKTMPFESGVRISAIRTFTTNPLSGTSQTKAAVEYLRPEPSIWISDQSSGLLGVGGIAVDVTDVGNRWKKTIVIWITGDIEIL